MTGPSLTRQCFLDTAEVVVALLNEPAVATYWDEPSVLPGLSVGALAAHLARSVLQVDRYLAAPAPTDSTSAVTASHYFALADALRVF